MRYARIATRKGCARTPATRVGQATPQRSEGFADFITFAIFEITATPNKFFPRSSPAQALDLLSGRESEVNSDSPRRIARLRDRFASGASMRRSNIDFFAVA
jgi:hypothetical protein